LQYITLPTLCGEGINRAKFTIAFLVDVLIFLRLMLFKSSDLEKRTYLIILITSPFWIDLFISLLFNLFG